MKRLLYISVILLSCGLAQATVLSEWTIMIYMEANNNLETAALADVDTIIQGMGINPTSHVRLLLQISRTGDTDTRRYLISSEGPTELAALPRMGQDPVAELTDFFAFGVDTYPADHYCLILWSHGSGAEVWKPPYKQVTKQQEQEAKQGRGILYNDVYDTALGNEGLVEVAQANYTKLGRKVDVFAADACYMASFEKCYDIRGFVDFFVGSEETEPAAGYDYVSWLSDLTLEPGITPQQLASLLVSSYGAFFTPTAEQKWTLTGADLSKIDDVVDALHDVIDGIASYRQKLGAGSSAVISRVQRGRKSALEMTVGEFVDLKSFLQNLLNQLPTVPKLSRPSPQQSALTALRRKINTAIAELSNAIIARSFSSRYSNAGGLTIVFPRDGQFDESYQGTSFANFQPWWKTFVTSYFG